MKRELIFFRNRGLNFGLIRIAVTFTAYQPVWNGKLLGNGNGHLTRPELRSVNYLARIWTGPGVALGYVNQNVRRSLQPAVY